MDEQTITYIIFAGTILLIQRFMDWKVIDRNHL